MVARCSMQIHFERTSYQSCTIRASIWFYSVYSIRGYVPFLTFFGGFFSFFFCTYGYSRDRRCLAPKRNLGLDPLEIHFLNSPILLSSRATVTWAHHATLAGKEKWAVYALIATISLDLVFTGSSIH